ncbi:MAG: hypothetical protein ACJAZO_002603 [Myxococcota bacterium]|jgi:hypothetical protein
MRCRRRRVGGWPRSADSEPRGSATWLMVRRPAHAISTSGRPGTSGMAMATGSSRLAVAMLLMTVDSVTATTAIRTSTRVVPRPPMGSMPSIQVSRLLSETMTLRHSPPPPTPSTSQGRRRKATGGSSPEPKATTTSSRPTVPALSGCSPPVTHSKTVPPATAAEATKARSHT